METFFWTLLLAAISAITYIAYRHPTAFRSNIAYPLLALVILGVFSITVWYLAGSGVWINNLIEEIPKLEAETTMIEYSAQRLKEAHDLQIIALNVGGAIAAYLILLINLPKILLFDKHKNKDS